MELKQYKDRKKMLNYNRLRLEILDFYLLSDTFSSGKKKGRKEGMNEKNGRRVRSTVSVYSRIIYRLVFLNGLTKINM